MARPAKFDRNEALASAMDEIWANGLERSSVKTLSELLGITRSSFYNAFGSRDELFLEVLGDYTRQSPDAALFRANDVSSPVLPLITRVLREICRAHASDPEARGCLLINSVCELCPDEEGLGGKLSSILLGSVENIERLLEIAREGGEIPADADVRALALAVQNTMAGLAVLSKVVRSEDDLWNLTRTTLSGLGLYRKASA